MAVETSTCTMVSCPSAEVHGAAGYLVGGGHGREGLDYIHAWGGRKRGEGEGRRSELTGVFSELLAECKGWEGRGTVDEDCRGEDPVSMHAGKREGRSMHAC